MFTPPVVKPPLPPLKPPSPPPYKFPPILREPPTQTDPQIDIPNKPPTEKDLLGIVCIYSNPPTYTPKKIRYRYPGGNWQEIAGESYSLQQEPEKVIATYRPRWLAVVTCRMLIDGHIPAGTLQNVAAWMILNPSYVPGNPSPTFRGIYLGWQWLNPFTTNGSATYDNFGVRLSYLDENNVLRTAGLLPEQASSSYGFWFFTCVSRTIASMTMTPENPVVIPGTCRFRVFNATGQTLLDITNSVCPEVEVVPAKCEFFPENERLVKKWLVSFLGRIYVEYQANCAIVKYQASPVNIFAITVYRECSDPACPPPKIRLDPDCEETCEQCPPNTVVKVLQGNTIACVDSNGCILKRIEFKPGCNTYDCVCD